MIQVTHWQWQPEIVTLLVRFRTVDCFKLPVSAVFVTSFRTNLGFCGLGLGDDLIKTTTVTLKLKGFNHDAPASVPIYPPAEGLGLSESPFPRHFLQVIMIVHSSLSVIGPKIRDLADSCASS